MGHPWGASKSNTTTIQPLVRFVSRILQSVGAQKLCLGVPKALASEYRPMAPQQKWCSGSRLQQTPVLSIHHLLSTVSLLLLVLLHTASLFPRRAPPREEALEAFGCSQEVMLQYFGSRTLSSRLMTWQL